MTGFGERLKKGSENFINHVAMVTMTGVPEGNHYLCHLDKVENGAGAGPVGVTAPLQTRFEQQQVTWLRMTAGQLGGEAAPQRGRGAAG